MARKLELTWVTSGGGRWRKRVTVAGKKKDYYFPYGKCKSDMDGYRQALDAWRKTQTLLDAKEAQSADPLRAKYQGALAQWQDVRDWLALHGTDNDRQYADDAISRLQNLLLSKRDLPSFEPEFTLIGAIASGEFGHDASSASRLWLAKHPNGHVLTEDGELIPADSENSSFFVDETGDAAIGELEKRDADHSIVKERIRLWMDRLRTLREAKTKVELDKTLGSAVGKFLFAKRIDAQNGDCSIGRWDSLRVHLEKFESWVGADLETENLKSAKLEDFVNYIKELIGKGEISRSYGRDLVASMKQFVGWCVETDRIATPPRNLRRLRIASDSGRGTPKSWTINEIKLILGSATERDRLFYLLMLNCGFGQTDLAKLEKHSVNWKNGTITHRRSKTGRYGGVPTVTYKLWPETLRLLKLHQSDHPELVFVNRDGKPLVESEWREGEDKKAHRKRDCVHSAFNRLRRKLGVTKTLKVFRKTSGNLLYNHAEYGNLSGYFLDHAPRSVAERHYVTPEQKRFDAAVHWLGQKYGIVPVVG